jgi:hypothetical protein
MSDVQNLKKIMSLLESSNRDDVKHRTMQDGIHKGDSAIGRYGIMPNTAKELAVRNIADNIASPLDGAIKGSSTDNVERILKDNPDKYDQYATGLAEHVLDNAEGDVPAAAAGWLYGHNMSAEKMRSKLNADPEYKNRVNSAIDTLHLKSEPEKYSDQFLEESPKEVLFSKIRKQIGLK